MSEQRFTKGMVVEMTEKGHKHLGYLPPIRGTVAHNPQRADKVGVILSWQSTVCYYDSSFWKPSSTPL